MEQLRIGLQWLLNHTNINLDTRPNIANVFNYNISEIVQVIENVLYRDDMQVETQEIQERNIKAPIDELNKGCFQKIHFQKTYKCKQ